MKYTLRYRQGFDGEDLWYDPKRYDSMAKAKAQVKNVAKHALLEFLEGEPFIREIAILEVLHGTTGPAGGPSLRLKHEWVIDEFKYEMFY